MTACMLVIGNEVLSGRTPDRNLNHLARRLSDLGIELREARVLPDDEAMIVEAVNEARARYRYVFTTGGIGPTHDDITADSIAKAFGVGISHHPDAVAVLKANYSPEMLNEARLRMARIPVGASLVKNPVSHAPGFRIENVYVFAGVPAIMQAMFEEIAHELEGGPPAASVTVSCFLGEGGGGRAPSRDSGGMAARRRDWLVSVLPQGALRHFDRLPEPRPGRARCRRRELPRHRPGARRGTRGG